MFRASCRLLRAGEAAATDAAKTASKVSLRLRTRRTFDILIDFFFFFFFFFFGFVLFYLVQKEKCWCKGQERTWRFYQF
jgi:hypothetical protein